MGVGSIPSDSNDRVGLTIIDLESGQTTGQCLSTTHLFRTCLNCISDKKCITPQGGPLHTWGGSPFRICLLVLSLGALRSSSFSR